jgi:hypothetical protein
MGRRLLLLGTGAAEWSCDYRRSCSGMADKIGVTCARGRWAAEARNLWWRATHMARAATTAPAASTPTAAAGPQGTLTQPGMPPYRV